MSDARTLDVEVRDDRHSVSMMINMGPQHPSTHGVLRVVLRLDGERVVDCDVVIGYLHRGIEKLCEQRDWAQIVLITDRMDYVAAATNNLGYCETVEKLMSLEVPKRAQYIRTILSELQRIASHCLWLGTHAMDIGAMSVFLYAFRERELILDLFEEYCGARLTYNAMRIGGLPQEIPPGWDKKVLEFCRIMSQKIEEYEELQELVAESLEEHKTVKALLWEIKNLKSDGQVFERNIQVLMENVEHHAEEEEEGKMFPMIRRIFTSRELGVRGRELEAAKNKRQRKAS